jgi:hypothetical protein
MREKLWQFGFTACPDGMSRWQALAVAWLTGTLDGELVLPVAVV